MFWRVEESVEYLAGPGRTGVAGEAEGTREIRCVREAGERSGSRACVYDEGLRETPAGLGCTLNFPCPASDVTRPLHQSPTCRDPGREDVSQSQAASRLRHTPSRQWECSDEGSGGGGGGGGVLKCRAQDINRPSDYNRLDIAPLP